MLLYKLWKKIFAYVLIDDKIKLPQTVLEKGLINHPVVGFGESGRKTSNLRFLLAIIKESEV